MMGSLVKKTLAEQVYEILREEIIRQDIKCGTKLTLKGLQEKFQVSSTPVREAVRRLSQDGLVDQVTNVGVHVIELDNRDVRELYDLCSGLDAHALRLALASGRVEELLIDLDYSLAQQEEAIQFNDKPRFIFNSNDFHLLFYKYADNKRLSGAADTIEGQFTILSSIYQSYTVALPVILAQHREIAETIRKHDFTEAVRLLLEHFEYGKNYVLNNLSEGQK